MAVQASLSGHTVLTTMHASSIGDGLSRFSKFLGDNGNAAISNSMRFCIHQSLSQTEDFSNRFLSLKCLYPHQSVKNVINDGNFNQLATYSDSQTSKLVFGG